MDQTREATCTIRQILFQIIQLSLRFAATVEVDIFLLKKEKRRDV
jgi:hypothetical protein